MSNVSSHNTARGLLEATETVSQVDSDLQTHPDVSITHVQLFCLSTIYLKLKK